MLLGDPRDVGVLLGDLLLQGLALRLQGLRRGGGRGRLQRGGCILEELLLPVVEETRLEIVLLAELGDGDLVNVVAPEDGGLLVGGERSARLVGHGLSWSRSYGGGGESHASAGAVEWCSRESLTWISSAEPTVDAFCRTRRRSVEASLDTHDIG